MHSAHAAVASMPWLLGSLGTVFLDLGICAQALFFRRLVRGPRVAESAPLAACADPPQLEEPLLGQACGRRGGAGVESDDQDT